jgi:large subunit ribosomal protein L4
MLVDIYNKEGKKIGQTRLPKEVFGIEMNSDLVHQVVLAQQANRKQITAHTKDRAEVRGGGKKPWRQKGTGRARHGSIRSPIWKGGGVTFGPRKEKVLEKKIPRKMRRKALFMVLSAKAKAQEIFVIDDLKVKSPKTKPLAELFLKLFLDKGSGLVAIAENDKNIVKSIRNIEKVKVMVAGDLNALDLLNYKYLILEKEAIKAIKETFVK